MLCRCAPRIGKDMEEVELTRQGLSPLISLPGYGSQKSGARSQNGGAVGVEQPAGFLQRGVQGVGVAVPEIVGEDQVIAAFLKRSFGDIHVAGFVGFAAAAEPWRYWQEWTPQPDAFVATTHRSPVWGKRR